MRVGCALDTFLHGLIAHQGRRTVRRGAANSDDVRDAASAERGATALGDAHQAGACRGFKSKGLAVRADAFAEKIAHADRREVGAHRFAGRGCGIASRTTG